MNKFERWARQEISHENRVQFQLPGHSTNSLIRFAGFQTVLEARSLLWRTSRWLDVFAGRGDALQELVALHNTDERPALVIAGGPSVSRIEAEAVRDRRERGELVVYAVNRFPLTSFAQISGLDNLVLSDPDSFGEVALGQLSEVSSQRPSDHLFVPQGMSTQVKATMKNTPVVEYCDVGASTLFSGGLRPDRPRRFASLTAYKALSIAIYIGHREISIIGFDNSYIHQLSVDSENRVGITEEHFDEHAYPGDGVRRIDSPLLSLPMHYVLQEYARTFSDLHRFSSGRITNLDPTSLTDAFQKRDGLC